MKAFLLSAGLGTRLRPLTKETPKCLLKIAGTALIDIWIKKLKRAKIEQILVNIHHLPDKMNQHLEKYSEDSGLVLSYEERLLGSAGTLLANRKFIGDDQEFLVCNADTLTAIDPSVLIKAHKEKKFLATLALIEATKPQAMGIVELDDGSVIRSFEEKPQNPKSNLAYAGLCVIDRKVMKYIDPDKPQDIGTHLLPQLCGLSKGVQFDDYLRDIGTLESYELAQDEWLEYMDQ